MTLQICLDKGITVVYKSYGLKKEGENPMDSISAPSRAEAFRDTPW